MENQNNILDRRLFDVFLEVSGMDLIIEDDFVLKVGFIKEKEYKQNKKNSLKDFWLNLRDYNVLKNKINLVLVVSRTKKKETVHEKDKTYRVETNETRKIACMLVDDFINQNDPNYLACITVSGIEELEEVINVADQYGITFGSGPGYLNAYVKNLESTYKNAGKEKVVMVFNVPINSIEEILFTKFPNSELDPNIYFS